MIFLLPRERRLDGNAIIAPFGASRKANTATLGLAHGAFEADSRPCLVAAVAIKFAFVEVLAVGFQTLRPLVAKIDQGRFDDHAQVALRLKKREHSLDRSELVDVLFYCKHIATSIEGAPQVSTCTKACDNDSITGLGDLAQDLLCKIRRLLAGVDFFPCDVHSSLAHLGPIDHVVALQRIHRHAEVLRHHRNIPMKRDNSHFCSGEELTRSSWHLVVSALVPSQNLVVLEIHFCHDLLDKAKLEGVAPQHYGYQVSDTFEKNHSTKKTSHRHLGWWLFIPRSMAQSIIQVGVGSVSIALFSLKKKLKKINNK